MACIQQICLFSLILAVIACHLVQFAEGRQLKPDFADNMSAKEIPDRQRFIIGDASKVNEKINYSAKQTGNSPGIGHSSSVPKTNYQTKHSNVEVSIDDVKAGHSPGIGHSSQSEIIGPNV
ncbi:hypothetical protein H5410_009197 [Solanum commersonii]|uniref:Uncharacterized protein n=1 Tax=Solanum commersonii TaxID=4109 RepID=A0A9J6AI13_SOLCO|nr:hypothetical protein H5410_009197 [Solanum commersonii]